MRNCLNNNKNNSIIKTNIYEEERSEQGEDKDEIKEKNKHERISIINT